MRFSVRLLILLSAWVSLLAIPGGNLARAAEPAAKPTIRVLLTYGGHGFEEKPFFALFDGLAGVQWTKAPMPQSAGLLKPGLEKDYDVIVMYDMVGKVSPEEQKAFVELLQRGIGLVSLHHNLGAHRDWDEFRQVVGGKFCFGVAEVTDRKLRMTGVDVGGKKYGPSGWAHGQDLQVAVADREHPITHGLSNFTIHDETYNKFYVAPDVHVLLTTDHPKNDPQIAWVKQYGKSRVFYFQLGHDSQAWKNPVYGEILLRGIRWTAGK